MQTQERSGVKVNPLASFASRFGAKIALNSEFIVEKGQRYYLLNPRLKRLVRTDFYYAGLYMGKVKNGIFFPSFNLLTMLKDVASNKVIVDKKAAWLFICGRDVFREGLVKVMGSQRKSDSTLVLNEFGECLGFGKIANRLDQAEGKVVLRNILDVGDFLRRETHF
jgi:ribosome biogenesis protein Nip4